MKKVPEHKRCRICEHAFSKAPVGVYVVNEQDYTDTEFDNGWPGNKDGKIPKYLAQTDGDALEAHICKRCAAEVVNVAFHHPDVMQKAIVSRLDRMDDFLEAFKAFVVIWSDGEWTSDEKGWPKPDQSGWTDNWKTVLEKLTGMEFTLAVHQKER